MDIKQVKQLCDRSKGFMNHIAKWAKDNLDSNNDSLNFSMRLDKFEEAFKQYCNAYDIIKSGISDLPDGDCDDMELIENMYFETTVMLQKGLNRLKPLSPAPPAQALPILAQQTQVEVRLPQINIKPFKGDTTEWRSFIQLFNTLIIENNSLSNIQRFIYLKSLLRDEPLKLIDNFAVTNENFDSALNILQKRYENKLSIVNTHFVSLFEGVPLTKCNASSLREFVMTCKSNLCSLENLRHSYQELFELLTIYLLGRKIDFGTRKAYELERDQEELPDLDDFFEFLERRCLALENLVSSEVPSVPKNQKVNKTSLYTHNHLGNTIISGSCLYCNDNFHKIYTCYKFKSLSEIERKRFITSKRLCFNCFGSKHSVIDCITKISCMVCGQRHHTLIHNVSTSQRTLPLQQQRQLQDTHNRQQSSHSTNTSPQINNTLRNTHNPQNRNQTSQNSQRRLDTQNCPPNSGSSSNSQSDAPQNKSISAISTKNTQVLLATAIVSLYDSSGHKVDAKAILDNGSQNSFVTDRLVHKLGCKVYSKSTCISGIALSTNLSRKMTDLMIYSNVFTNRRFKLTCAILPVITAKLPHVTVSNSSWNIPDGIPLADPLFDQPSEIDLLIGSDLYYDLLTEGIIRLGRNLPTIVNTHLGWIIGGTFAQGSHDNIVTSHLNISQPPFTSLFAYSEESPALETIVTKFWAMEELPAKASLSPDDEVAEAIFTATTKILNNGTFQVNLPLKSPHENLKLGDSLSIAKRRFNNLELKFQKNPEYYLEYKRFIDDYVTLGHAKYVPLYSMNELSQPKYFLPHHAVLKEDSPTTKLRVVFDASCKSSSGVCLNDITHKGYQVQPDLYDILLRFRSYKYALTADIEKMFRQIKINPDQTFLLNILWRTSPDQPLDCIELSTVTYGTNSAPFLAIRVLVELALKGQQDYPLASESLLHQCYVDDILAGCDTQPDLEKLYNELNTLLNSFGFKLHKWGSNSVPFLKQISQIENPNLDINFNDMPNKVVGLKWNANEDCFSVVIPEVTVSAPITKRKILSTIAQCYDPLGFLSLVIITGKLIIQRLWTLKIDWDVPITDKALLQEWKTFVESLPLLKAVKIPRYLFLDKSITKIEFHGFSDASLKAYSACVYLRTLYIDNTVSCTLISSKSRVAPLQTISLPRLELCAMVLLSQLVTKLISIYETRFKIDSVTLYTDSQIALCWISSSAHRWNTFVANRVSLIQDLTSPYQWRHINSSQNVADLPSRGIPIHDVEQCRTWWQGPTFLSDPNLQIPADSVIPISEIPEERKISLLTTPRDDSNIFWLQTFEKFSSFARLQRSIAYVLRFIANTKIKNNRTLTPLTVPELDSSLKFIIKILQSHHFSKEISELSTNRRLSDKGLAKLNPFLDQNSIFRVGGRLENAEVPFEQKHPILLPSKNYVVSLMLRQEHQRLGHAGAQNTLSNFRLRFWPQNGLRSVKRIILDCVTCHRFKAQPAEQLMANLPEERVITSRCFSRVGIDYGGPFFIKSSNLRKAPLIKCYIAIFVCMVTKAIHIELVTGLTTEHFLMTLKRFIARRGNPKLIFCDNATNFLGARNQLKELYQFFQNQINMNSLKEFLSQNEIDFKFIPPRSPHWGGIWEAAIKSAKYHLIRLVGETRFTFEEFYTILSQIEAILNSRPLCPLSNDPNDVQALTPGHFLIGTNLTSYPDKGLTEIPSNRLTLWQKISQIQQSFWKFWSIDYLNRLQNRPKWFRSNPNLKVDTLALLKNDDTPPLRWPLARIIEVIPGSDGRIRMVKVKTQDNVFTRSISKICPLPNTDNQVTELF